MTIATPDTLTVGAVTVNCAVLTKGRARKASAKISVKEVMGGDTVIVNKGGLGPKMRTYTLYIADTASLVDLEDDILGQTMTLVSAEDTVTGVIEDLDATDWLSADDTGAQEVRITFIVTS